MIKRRAEAMWIESRARWQINVQRDGQRKTFTSRTEGRRGKHEAEAKADKWLERFATEQTLGSALALYMEDKESQVKSGTLSTYTTIVKRILAVIPPNRRLSLITPYDWQRCINAYVAEGGARSSAANYSGFIMSFNSYCWLRRWECEELRTGMLHIPETAAKPKKKTALNGEQLRALFALDPDTYSGLYLFQFAVLTGLRRGELIALTWACVSDTGVTVTEGKTANAARVVPLSTAAQQLIAAHRARLIRLNRLGEFAFPNERKGCQVAPDVLHIWWKKIASAIGAENVTIHELRHTFISIVKSDLPLAQLKQVVGHSLSMDTYGTYAHQTDTDLAREKQAIDTAFNSI